MIGSAVRVMREPNALIAWADHSRMKSAWAHRPVRGNIAVMMPDATVGGSEPGRL
jgi:hypothetical protein